MKFKNLGFHVTASSTYVVQKTEEIANTYNQIWKFCESLQWQITDLQMQINKLNEGMHQINQPQQFENKINERMNQINQRPQFANTTTGFFNSTPQNKKKTEISSGKLSTQPKKSVQNFGQKTQPNTSNTKIIELEQKLYLFQQENFEIKEYSQHLREKINQLDLYVKNLLETQSKMEQRFCELSEQQKCQRQQMSYENKQMSYENNNLNPNVDTIIKTVQTKMDQRFLDLEEKIGQFNKKVTESIWNLEQRQQMFYEKKQMSYENNNLNTNVDTIIKIVQTKMDQRFLEISEKITEQQKCQLQQINVDTIIKIVQTKMDQRFLDLEEKIGQFHKKVTENIWNLEQYQLNNDYKLQKAAMQYNKLHGILQQIIKTKEFDPRNQKNKQPEDEDIKEIGQIINTKEFDPRNQKNKQPEDEDIKKIGHISHHELKNNNQLILVQKPGNLVQKQGNLVSTQDTGNQDTIGYPDDSLLLQRNSPSNHEEKKKSTFLTEQKNQENQDMNTRLKNIGFKDAVSRNEEDN